MIPPESTSREIHLTLKAPAYPRAHLQVVSRLRRDSGDVVREQLARDLSVAVVDDGVADVEAPGGAARRVEFDDPAHVHREVCLAPVVEVADGERLGGRRGEGDGVRADELRDLAEADEAGPRFGEDADLPPALADLRAELHLRRVAARTAVRKTVAREKVTLGLGGDMRVEVVSGATAEASLRVDGILARRDDEEGEDGRESRQPGGWLR